MPTIIIPYEIALLSHSKEIAKVVKIIRGEKQKIGIQIKRK